MNLESKNIESDNYEIESYEIENYENEHCENENYEYGNHDIQHWGNGKPSENVDSQASLSSSTCSSKHGLRMS